MTAGVEDACLRPDALQLRQVWLIANYSKRDMQRNRPSLTHHQADADYKGAQEKGAAARNSYDAAVNAIDQGSRRPALKHCRIAFFCELL